METKCSELFTYEADFLARGDIILSGNLDKFLTGDSLELTISLSGTLTLWILGKPYKYGTLDSLFQNH